MGRQKKPRYCREFAGYNLFKPSGVPLAQLEIVEIGLDELEAMRLCDFDGHDQETAAAEMGVSRGTVQRLLYSGRRKLIDTVVHGKALVVSGAEHVLIRPPGRHGRGWGGRWAGQQPKG
ncbi:MAG TPA: DUF134 domain-containing protein [Candidatus Acetothermia bacterium]|nr:DUF134 domain-containing protein [Candidatus Bipolaricaulota bacterium]HDJ29560.1 DUF134 domain-containing protein [Candidatus Acetothermia bacterium]